MKFRESGGAALRVRTLDTPQQAAAAITRAKASTGPLAPSSTAATPMPASATAIPSTLYPARSFAERRRREQGREDRLDLEHQGGEPGGHPRGPCR